MSTTALVDYEAILAKQREDTVARLGAPAGDYVKISLDKTFTFPDGDTTGGPFEAILLDFQWFNVLYEGAFVRGQANRALCYANGAVEERLIPAEGVPQKQSDKCSSCPKNQFGSAGKGKACKNHILLALLRADATEEDSPLVLRLPPTANKNYAKYIRDLKNLGYTRSEVVTRVGFNPNSQYPEPIFAPLFGPDKKPVLNPILEVSLSKLGAARERLEQEKADTSERPAQGKVARR